MEFIFCNEKSLLPVGDGFFGLYACHISVLGTTCGGIRRVERISYSYNYRGVWQWFSTDGQEMPVRLLDAWETFLRKGAHFFVFSVLGFCVANAVRHICLERRPGGAGRSDAGGDKRDHSSKKNGHRRVFWISLCWCSAYGALDELHQYFVPGRACMWQDWLIDTMGAALGIWITCLFIWRKEA